MREQAWALQFKTGFPTVGPFAEAEISLSRANGYPGCFARRAFNAGREPSALSLKAGGLVRPRFVVDSEGLFGGPRPFAVWGNISSAAASSESIQHSVSVFGKVPGYVGQVI